MQEKDAEAINHQRKRRKRIARIKTGIVCIVSGWIMLSMILIVVLLVQVVRLEHKVDNIMTANTGNEVLRENGGGYTAEGETIYTDGTESTEAAAPDTESAVEAVPPAVGIDEEENLAGDTDVHKVYLTFDGGPSENTAEILDILAEYDVKATFFVAGSEDEDADAIYQRIVDEGHTLGMHSYSNKYSVIYQSAEAFEEDFTKLWTRLYEVTGTESIYYRFPGGSSNQVSNVPMSELIRYLNGEGVIYYDWNVSAGDAASSAYSAEEIVANVMEGVVKYKTSVVLLHDASENTETVQAIGSLIEALREADAQILPIDEDADVIQYVKADDAGQTE